MQSIPLVRARYAIAFIRALEKRGAPANPYRKSARLSEGLLENPDGVISASSLWKLAGDSGRDPDLCDIGLEAGAMPIDAHGDFGSRVIFAPSLYQAIKAFCGEARSEYSRSDFYLARDSDTAWFCRGPIEGTGDQVRQIELYLIMLMMQTIRRALGPCWKPSQLRLQTRDDRGLERSDVLRGINISFGAPHTAIGIPLASLAAPLQKMAGISVKPLERNPSDSMKQALPEEPLEALIQFLSSHIRFRSLPIDLAAEVAGVSTRTLQRHLMQQGITYTQLIDETRFRLARKMLHDKNFSITGIAFELGYSDGAHFSRAFRRMTGLSPRSYREQYP